MPVARGTMTDMSAAAAQGATDAHGPTDAPGGAGVSDRPGPGASGPEDPDVAAAGARPSTDPWAGLTDLAVDDAVSEPDAADAGWRGAHVGPDRVVHQPDASLRDHAAVPNDSDALSAPHARARDLAETGDLVNARTLLEQTLSAAELNLGREHPRLAPLMVDLATIARSLGNLTEAQNQLRRAYGIVVAAGGPEHPTALSIEGRLAAVTYRLGEPTEPYDWHLADVGGRILGPDHPAIRGALRRLAAARDATPPMTTEEQYQAQHAGDHEPEYPPAGAAYVGPASYESTYVPAADASGVYQRAESLADDPVQPRQEVEVWRNAPRRPRRRGHGGGLALVASLGATALVAGVVVALQLFAPDRGADRSAQAPPISAAPAVPPTEVEPPTPTPAARAPTGLRLRDDGGSVTLRWNDPSAGLVPFIVTGGRIGATPAPLDSVPSGRTTSTIYGLNARFDYCFTVAAVWSPDEIASSIRTCTDRLSD
jgi:hypothetical protein